MEIQTVRLFVTIWGEMLLVLAFAFLLGALIR